MVASPRTVLANPADGSPEYRHVLLVERCQQRPASAHQMRDHGCILGAQLGRKGGQADFPAEPDDLRLEPLRVGLSSDSCARRVVA